MATVTCSECGHETEYDEADSSDRIPCTHCNNLIEL
jgi:DNA-directed RNA polymerase subunit RPC12/RpoP